MLDYYLTVSVSTKYQSYVKNMHDAVSLSWVILKFWLKPIIDDYDKDGGEELFTKMHWAL